MINNSNHINMENHWKSTYGNETAKPKSKGKILFVIIALLLLLASIYAAYYYFKLLSKETDVAVYEIANKTVDNVTVRFVMGQFIVKFKESVSFEGLDSNKESLNILNQKFNIFEIEQLYHPKGIDNSGLSRIYLLKFSTDIDIDLIAKEYEEDDWVEYVELNQVGELTGVPNDPSIGSQWYINNIKAPEAWDITTGESWVKIAILDTGMDLDHEDLQAKIVVSRDFTGSVIGGNDGFGHGVFIAGIAAADTNNNKGIAGVGYDSSLMNVKVIDDMGFATSTDMANGIIWATDNGANVISISWIMAGTSSTLENAVNYAWENGVVITAGAGNSGGTYPYCPACYENVIAVAATTPDDTLWSSSQYGNWVDVAAPGVSMYSTWKNNGYTGGGSGTSFATPQVAALAALLFPLVTDTNENSRINDEIRNIIESTTVDLPPDPWKSIANGRIDAYEAVLAASGSGPDTSPPLFLTRYYSDIGMTNSLGDNPHLGHLGAGVYYLKISSNEPLSGAPTVTIDAEGDANDVTDVAATLVSGNVYRLDRVISQDDLAFGTVLEDISITGTDSAGNTATNINPTNEAITAAYTDTTPPASFTIQYYAPPGLWPSLGDNPVLGVGTYNLKITPNEALIDAPTVTIDAEGTANDITDTQAAPVSWQTYSILVRDISEDPLAVGAVLEDISITGTDLAGNTVTNLDPANEATKAAYTETTAATTTTTTTTLPTTTTTTTTIPTTTTTTTVPTTTTTSSTTTTTIPCTNCGLDVPEINPSSPEKDTAFTISCPADDNTYDCLRAFANTDSNECTWSSWNGNNAVYDCSSMSAGTYTAKCKSITGTGSNCCSDEKTVSYTIASTTSTTTTTTTTTTIIPDTTPPEVNLKSPSNNFEYESVDVCLSAADGTVSCSYKANCDATETCLATISSDADAYVADCVTNPYATKICCSVS